jgi:hypothetical protein
MTALAWLTALGRRISRPGGWQLFATGSQVAGLRSSAATAWRVRVMREVGVVTVTHLGAIVRGRSGRRVSVCRVGWPRPRPAPPWRGVAALPRPESTRRVTSLVLPPWIGGCRGSRALAGALRSPSGSPVLPAIGLSLEAAIVPVAARPDSSLLIPRRGVISLLRPSCLITSVIVAVTITGTRWISRSPAELALAVRAVVGLRPATLPVSVRPAIASTPAGMWPLTTWRPEVAVR